MLKKVSLLLIASLSLGLMVGCSGGDDGAGPEASGPPATNVNAKPIDDGQQGGGGGANKDGAAAPPSSN